MVGETIIFLFLFWFIYHKWYGKNKDVRQVHTKCGFHWSIDSALNKLQGKNTKLTSSIFSFARQQWMLELEHENLAITLNIKRKSKASHPDHFPKVEWGVGIKSGDGEERLSHWSRGQTTERIPSEWTTVGHWTGPSLADLLLETSLTPGGVLTLCIQLSDGPSFSISNPKDYYKRQKIRNVSGVEMAKSSSAQTVQKLAENLRSNKTLETLARNLHDMYRTSKDCDVTIKVKDKTFEVHRTILSARTPVMDSIFTSKQAEKERWVICLGDCDPEAFEVFLQFLYSGLTNNLTSENVVRVYYIAHKYDLPDLKEMCSQFMSSTLTVESVCNVISLATKNEEQVLLENATNFFLKNAKEILPTVEWQRFLNKNPTHANELIMKFVK